MRAPHGEALHKLVKACHEKGIKLLLYFSLIACMFLPWGMASADGDLASLAIGLVSYVTKLAMGGFLLAGVAGCGRHGVEGPVG